MSMLDDRWHNKKHGSAPCEKQILTWERKRVELTGRTIYTGSESAKCLNP